MPTRPSITGAEIVKGLREAGLKTGDVVLLHSSVWSLGVVEGGPQAVIDAFFAVLGESGTLAVPAFGEFGVLSRLVREHPQAVQSSQLPARIAAVGPEAEALCHDHALAPTAHGSDTPYTRIADRGGYVCLLGVDQDRNTTLHSPEALLELAYLKPEPFEYTAEDGSTSQRTFQHYPGPHRDFIGLDRQMREAGIVKVVRVGRAAIRLMPSRELIDHCVALGHRDPAYALCDNPNCADCVGQRAALRRHRLQDESFTLAAAASLAGRYVPEMIENLSRCGLDHIELDLIQGVPVAAVEETKLRCAVQQLGEDDITVTGLRCPVIPADPVHLCETARELEVPRLIVPLGAEIKGILDAAASAGIAISVFNAVHSSVSVRDLLERLRGATLTFSPGGFARAGESPFLTSLNASKARRHLDQLDIEDCLRDGTPTALGQGHAEIRELISILRCGGFDGMFVLRGHAHPPGGLMQAVEHFDALLESL